MFDTRKRPNTKFGLETKDEMCLEFLFYYPAFRLAPGDGTMSNCGIFFDRRSQRGITTCGPASRRSSFLGNVSNPSFNDTQGTPGKFGDDPASCQRAAPTVAGSEPTTTPEESNLCFPGEVTVQLKSGELRHMKDVQIGDEVYVGNGQYSAVFMFTHKLHNRMETFVELETAKGVISLTPSHYMYANGVAVPARNVKVGDTVEDGESNRILVRRIRRVSLRGLYNPQTVHGDIVVNGIRASTYTTSVAPSVAHALLSALRALRNMFGLTTSVLDGGADGAACTLRSFTSVLPH